MDKRRQFHLWYVIAALIGFAVLQQLWAASQQVEVVPYSQYLDDLKANRIEEVRVSGSYIQGTYKEPKQGKKQFVTTRVPADIAADLESHGVRFAGAIQSNWLGDILSWI